MIRALALTLLACAPTALTRPAAAQDYIVTSGRLDQNDFYRLVACGAPPGGGDCAMPFVRWSESRRRNLRVGMELIQPYPPRLADEMSWALDVAIGNINSVGAGIRLVRETKVPAADVVVRLVPFGNGDRLRDTGVRELDGEIMGAAYVYVWWNGRQEITDAVILMADDLPSDEVLPVLLEELTQSLGFLHDIRNPLYERESVFSEDSNSVVKLGPQDRAAILQHYPPAR